MLVWAAERHTDRMCVVGGRLDAHCAQLGAAYRNDRDAPDVLLVQVRTRMPVQPAVRIVRADWLPPLPMLPRVPLGVWDWRPTHCGGHRANPAFP